MTVKKSGKILSDIEIAQQAKLQPIGEIAASLNIKEDDLETYGKYKAKLPLSIASEQKHKQDGNLILVTSINPTTAGEGKSTVTVGLGDALNALGKKTVLALREPSLGPTMGIKGGACGGGYAQVVPMEDINLHFTGDLHAITAANNALSAFIDNHIYHGNELNINPKKILWKRALDINDRSLRNSVIGLGGVNDGIPREEHFDITAASEMMALFCLAENLHDLKEKISKIVVAYNIHNEPVTVSDLQVAGALTLLLKDAIKPNLVQTLEHTPAIISGGPFANIAHGCNSLIATKTALKLADYVVTEAGFGADLGAEKFFDIKCQIGNLKPAATVIVATIRALKLHGGVTKDMLHNKNIDALKTGFANLQRHIETIKQFGVPFIVALNKFITDTEEEIIAFQTICEENGIPWALTEVWEKGSPGGIDLAENVIKIVENTDYSVHSFKPVYSFSDSIEDKLLKVVQKVYGGKGIELTSKAKKQLKVIEENGWGNLPICIAKTQYSLSDQPQLLGRPENFTITIREFKPQLGAGFIVALTGDMMTMPGLPKKPAALQMDMDDNGQVTGLF
ncbi:formate--tetrahydrofolate ligase [Bacillus kwashiorkori]|uniref:formate--tetrahydrofolate ligase n=1 Tax=Bacillus kwashiorkori TaxID=1522318 RepID=UPI000782D99C|nr:formate--tetrahydrofolate ligase [Bacillus kwashiorkori]